MPFDKSQSAYIALRDIFGERSDTIAAWVGAGLSASAHLPSWTALRRSLTAELEQSILRQTDDDLIKTTRALLDQSQNAKTPWESFWFLKKGLGNPEYHAHIKKAMANGDTAVVPRIYKDLWKLGVHGIVNLNLDRLAQRAFAEVYSGQICCDFIGGDAEHYVGVLKEPRRWLAYLHGRYDNTSSWVFTESELKALMQNKGYQLFVKSLFATRCVVFLGISADDESVGGHLASLTNQGIDCGEHFWITDRKDSGTVSWTHNAGIRLIHYNNPDGAHSELNELLSDLIAFVPRDSEPVPIAMKEVSHSGILPTPELLIQSPSAQEIRKLLNSEATRILASNSQEAVNEFERFAEEYAESIHRAWFIPPKPENTTMLGYTILNSIAEGGFGTVFRAVKSDDPNGTQLAIKVLHERIRNNHEMLQSFRRGVRSMQILTDQKVKGVVPFCDASEIPAMVVMDFVEGINLAEAVRRGVLNNWRDLLHVAIELASIIRSSHRLSQRVLHRDIRPANVMLQNCWSPNPNWSDVDVVVLDFDLSWHLDAFDVSIGQNGVVSGFLAPEQIDRNSGMTTRSAAVDSFGLGMTLYFLRSGVDPIVFQHRHKDWGNTLKDCALNYPCPTWSSLPRRFSRLIEMATQNDQHRRWEMAFILGELEQLAEAERSPSAVKSAELLAEEIASRALDRQYSWDTDRCMAEQQLGGSSFSITGDERLRKILFQFGWKKVGGEDHQRLRKWLPEREKRVRDRLIKAGWRVIDVHYNTGLLTGQAEVSVQEASEHLDRVSQVIGEVRNDLYYQ